MRILIVDDEALILRALARVLRAHAVSTAQGGAEALAVIGGGQVFDAILCDVHMPGMNGRALYETLFALLPELAARVVFIAGGFSPADDAAFFRSRPTILKPFEAKELHALLLPLGPTRPLATRECSAAGSQPPKVLSATGGS